MIFNPVLRRFGKEQSGGILKTSPVVSILLILPAVSFLAGDDHLLGDKAIDTRIQKYHTTQVTLILTDNSGKPLANTEVVITMQRHKFLFGCNLYRWGDLDDKKLEEDYRRNFAKLFNFATLPFYWGIYEPEQGKTRETHLRAMATWCRLEGIQTKGHPLVWHEVPAQWQTTMDMAALHQLQMARVEREVKTFAGLIDIWDVVNEAVVMPQRPEPIGRLCAQLGREELISAAFDVARKTNSKGTLILNDYSQDRNLVRLIRRCLNAKVPMDVIGIQSHMHEGYSGAKQIWKICEMFAQFDKPLHWTETTILSGRLKTWEGFEPVGNWETTPHGEKRQAAQVVDFYRVLFSHPEVEAITWWDLSDNGSWVLAPAGLLRKDMTPKPAYRALQQLIKGKWWTGPLRLTTDDTGSVKFQGFLGDYKIRTPKHTREFYLDVSGITIINITV